MEEGKKKVQENYVEFQIIGQQIKQLQKQLDMVTYRLMELSSIVNSFEDFSRITSEKEVFVPLSSGIFARASIKSTSELLVNVGANVVVAKDTASTKKLLQKQMEELKAVQKQVIGELERMTAHAMQLEARLQGAVPEA